MCVRNSLIQTPWHPFCIRTSGPHSEALGTTTKGPTAFSGGPLGARCTPPPPPPGHCVGGGSRNSLDGARCILLLLCSHLRVPCKRSVRRTASVWQAKYNIYYPAWQPHRPSSTGRLLGPWNLSPADAVGCDRRAMMACRKGGFRAGGEENCFAGGGWHGSPFAQPPPPPPWSPCREGGLGWRCPTCRDGGGGPKAAPRRNMRREERVTIQGPVKEQQLDGMSHRGGGGPTPTYMAQNDPRVALIILTTHMWGTIFS